QTDPQFQNLRNNFTPNFGAGIYLHSEKSYVGLSVPNFFQTTRYDDNDVAVNQERMNFYLIGGYVFDLTYNLKFKPAFLTKVVEGAPMQVDISANFLYEEKFMLGAAWRWGAAVSALAGFQVTDGLFIGYAHDRETTRLRRFNQGSHEIFLRFELFNNYSRIVSPRFF
ncbi:MAG: type IX secretion system membrane protein PorP/SprF, partial [Flavobacterium sp.]